MAGAAPEATPGAAAPEATPGAAPLTRRTIHPLDLGIEVGLSPRALFHMARQIPRLTMHDMVAFVPLYRELGIVDFGVGAILGNLVVNALVLVRPAPALRVSRHPVWALVSGALFVGLAGMCVVRFVEIVGAVVLFLPSASAAALPPEGGNTPHVRDTRRLLASAYVAAGLFLLSCGTGIAGEAYLRLAAVLRAVSLLVLVAVNSKQIRNGNWKPKTLVPYVVAFPLMALAYLVMGVLGG